MAELECIPFAVGHANEGVCILMYMGPYRILLDCGLRDLSPLLEQALDVPNDSPSKRMGDAGYAQASQRPLEIYPYKTEYARLETSFQTFLHEFFYRFF